MLRAFASHLAAVDPPTGDANAPAVWPSPAAAEWYYRVHKIRVILVQDTRLQDTRLQDTRPQAYFHRRACLPVSGGTEAW